MANQLKTGKLDTLQINDVLIVQARQVANDKVSLEFAEILDTNSNRSRTALGIFNKSDERFSSGARRAWLTCEPSDAAELLEIDGLSFEDDAKDWYEDEETGYVLMQLTILNPTVDGIPLKVEVTETITPTDWQKDNLKRAAKKAGRDGEFITHQDCHVFSNTDVVIGEANHTFLEPDTRAVSTTNKAILVNSNRDSFETVNTDTGEIVGSDLDS